MAEETKADAVKVAPSDAKAPADKKTEVAKAPEPEPAVAAPVIFAGAFALAVVVAIAQQSDVMNGGSLMRWGNSLFEEHIVPPPVAHESMVTIQFCQSCGTNGLFNQIAHLINNRADAELNVQPAGYPAPPMMMLFANIIGILQMTVMAMLFINDKLLPEGMRENKMASIFGVFLGANMFSGALTKTNAFEVYVGKKLIYSQLTMGRPPRGEDLIQGFKMVGININL